MQRETRARAVAMVELAVQEKHQRFWLAQALQLWHRQWQRTVLSREALGWMWVRLDLQERKWLDIFETPMGPPDPQSPKTPPATKNKFSNS